MQRSPVVDNLHVSNSGLVENKLINAEHKNMIVDLFILGTECQRGHDSMSLSTVRPTFHLTP